MLSRPRPRPRPSVGLCICPHKFFFLLAPRSPVASFRSTVLLFLFLTQQSNPAPTSSSSSSSNSTSLQLSCTLFCQGCPQLRQIRQVSRIDPYIHSGRGQTLEDGVGRYSRLEGVTHVSGWSRTQQEREEPRRRGAEEAGGSASDGGRERERRVPKSTDCK